MQSFSTAPTNSKYWLQFTYDWQGRRIQKVVYTNNGGWVLVGTNKFVYDGWNLIATVNGSSALTAAYTWGTDLSGSLQGAGGVGGLLFISGSGTQEFVCHDGNGNVTMLANAADGTPVAQYEYGPFGEVIRQTGPMAKVNPFRFSTKYTDDESDFLYYGYRYYNPSTGRWLSRDPIEEKGGLNLYGFVENDPIQEVDVLGNQTLTPSAQITGETKGFDYTGPDGSPHHSPGGSVSATITATVNADCNNGKLSNLSIGPITGDMNRGIDNWTIYIPLGYYSFEIKNSEVFDVTSGAQIQKTGGCCSGIYQPIHVHWHEDATGGIVPNFPGKKWLPIPLPPVPFASRSSDIANVDLMLKVICCGGHLTAVLQ